ncbi:general odorant-binding protein 56a-like [Lycorma delicatula]|uniref:general odorant-binding protein 56a-like n=1 Tax=Lycorma delicatula TaxID=130591 RepID=UPI003F51371F
MYCQFTLLFICLATSSCYVTDNNRDFVTKLFSDLKQCANTNSITKDNAKLLLLSDQLPVNQDEKCFMSCVFNEFGLIRDGRLDKGVSKALAKVWLGKSPDILGKTKVAIDICHVRAKPDVNNICEIGSSLKKCITEQMEKGIVLFGGI